MMKRKKSEAEVAVRCFCGESLSVNPRSRREVICQKCHQPLPMQAIKMAVEFRNRESAQANPLKRAPAGAV